MWVFGWPFYADRTAKLAKECGIVPPETSDKDASQAMINFIYCLKNRHPAEYISAEIDGEWRPMIALCRDEDARRREDAKIPPHDIPPLNTCRVIRQCLGIPASQAPEWYWTYEGDYDPPEDDLRECGHAPAIISKTDVKCRLPMLLQHHRTPRYGLCTQYRSNKEPFKNACSSASSSQNQV